MGYVKNIGLMEAVIHVLDKNSDEPVLNEYNLELTDEIYKFLYKHIEKALNSEELKCAVFNKENSIVKDVSQKYLQGENRDLVDVSKHIAKQLFYIMRGNSLIESCDLIIASITTDEGPMLAILKFDYIKSFTHKIKLNNEKVDIDIVEHLVSLPGSEKRLHKCAFIKSIKTSDTVNLMLIDKKRRINSEDEYNIEYFTNNFLNCIVVDTNKDMTKKFINLSETWIRTNVEGADRQIEVRTAIRDEIVENDTIALNNIVEYLNNDEAENYKVFLAGAVSEEFKIDKEYVEKKLKKIRLKIDSDIDIYMSQESYKDKSKFDIVKNGDGSINIIIKHIKNYIEK